jgi:hypothetical protein
MLLSSKYINKKTLFILILCYLIFVSLFISTIIILSSNEVLSNNIGNGITISIILLIILIITMLVIIK